ncbi:MAG: hypothetical protein M3R04_07345 [bacterium]|nr:hypothetical protein [bacterium]
MAEENTTDSTSTPEAPPSATPVADSPSSTTEAPQSPQPSDDEAAPATLLTPKTDVAKDEAEPDASAAFYGAPEAEYELSGLPEGTVIDTAALEAVTPIAKELNLSNEGFSKIAGVYADKVLPSVIDSVTDTLQRDIVATHAQWAIEATELVKTDPVFEGKQLGDVQQVSAKAIDRFFGPEFRTFLDDTGLGNHPQMLKGMYQVGSKIAEDTTFERGSTAPAPKSRTDKYYSPQT